MTGLRVKAIGRSLKPRLRFLSEAGSQIAGEALSEPRLVYWSERGAQVLTAVYRGEALTPGNEVPGPAIVELPDTTVTIRPGDRARVDGFGSLVLSVVQA